MNRPKDSLNAALVCECIFGCFNAALVCECGAFSPALFAVYIDGLIQTIQNQGLGCHTGLLSMAIFMYADDLVILSSSVTDLQRLINTCLNEFVALDQSINASKSICIRIGRHYNSVCNRVFINGSPIAWSDQFTYLGVAIKSAVKFTIDLKPRRANFYRSFNSL